MFLSKIKEDHKYQTRFICGCVLAVLTIVYNFVWIDKTFIMAEGWSEFYAGLLERGKIPYRDFYYYMPPLNLVVDYILWKMSFGYFFIYRIWRLAERILIIELMYKLISEKVRSEIALTGCFIAVIMVSANVYDVGGDYNQTNQLLIVILCIILNKYVENIDSLYIKIKWLFCAGICGGCMFLTKQPLVLANLIVFTFFMLFLITSKKEKNIIYVIISVITGACIPVGICAVYLGYNHAIYDFVYQVFLNTGSKGSLLDIILGKYVNIYYHERYGIFGGLFFAAYLYAKRKNIKIININNNLLIIIGIFLFCCGYSSVLIDFWTSSLSSGFIIIFMISSAVLLLSDSLKLKYYSFWISISLCYIALLFNINNMTITLYAKNTPFQFMVTILTFVYFALIVWFLYHIIDQYRQGKEWELDSLVLVCSGIASGYTTIMTNGEAGVVSFTAFISVPVFIYILFRDNTSYQIIHTKVLQIAGLTIFVICLSQKLVCAYSWWGDSEETYWDKTEFSQIKSLKGFKFSKEEKKKYDEIYNVINSNSDENDIIWGFPYAKVYNVFTNNYNMSGFSPVLFYDVCADDIAAYEAELISENKPDIVVWVDIPGCMEVHEMLFRKGNSLGQRQIQKWFSDAKDIEYMLIGQVDNVFVYKLQDDLAPQYTYIERKTKINETAEYSHIELLSCNLSGQGTPDAPYLINSCEEFIEFRDLVNSGYNFRGEYVQQTNNIDLSECGSWEPIGVYVSNQLFEGNYNGDGYEITGLYIDSPNENVGLFGQLAGTVENVSLVDCDITGACIGGIASHGVGGAAIVNCYVSGKLNGKVRAGGIADNLSGYIINCVAECIFEGGGINSGISGYYTNTIINCYSNRGNPISIDDGYKLKPEITDELNSYLSVLRSSSCDIEYNIWEAVTGNVKLISSGSK